MHVLPLAVLNLGSFVRELVETISIQLNML